MEENTALTALAACRLSEEDNKILLSVCKARGEAVGSFVRSAILKELARMGQLSEDRRKILLASI